uniref:Uncharacterized protein n=1 Tax=Alexandrium monilatum TaxID=311494 RepID=A0A6T0WRB0_9DINO
MAAATAAASPRASPSASPPAAETACGWANGSNDWKSAETACGWANGSDDWKSAVALEEAPAGKSRLMEYLRSHTAKGKTVLRAAVNEREAEAAIAEFEREQARHSELLAEFLRDRAASGGAERAKAILRAAARLGSVPLPGAGAVPVAASAVEEIIAKFEWYVRCQ